MSNRQEIKYVLQTLMQEWNWVTLNKRKYVANLIWTSSYGGYRKDNRVVQNVGKPKIKFKFNIGSYIGGSPTTIPTHFSIGTTGKLDRIEWMAKPVYHDSKSRNGDVFIRLRHGRTWGEPFRVIDYFEDPGNITDEELELFEFLYPNATAKLPELLPGLLGIDDALRERFMGGG